MYDVLEYLASGMSEDQILTDFPDLEREDIRACLAFAADRERRLVSLPHAGGCCSIPTCLTVSRRSLVRCIPIPSTLERSDLRQP